MLFQNMDARKEYYLTEQGLKKIKEELSELKEIKISKIQGEGPQSFSFGNAEPEFLDFRQEMAQLEKRIAEIEDVLEHYSLIKAPLAKERSKVYLGAHVFIETKGEIEEFIIVGTIEADPAEHKISDESPLGKALFGRGVGEAVDVDTAIVKSSCKIIRISYF